jgi:hypothetical protein
VIPALDILFGFACVAHFSGWFFIQRIAVLPSSVSTVKVCDAIEDQ